MNIAAMDTHKIVKRLESAGFKPEQAEAVTDILRESRDADFSQLATKADLAATKAELKAEIDSLRKDMVTKDEFRAIKIDVAVLKWMMGILIAGVATLVLKAFFA